MGDPRRSFNGFSALGSDEELDVFGDSEPFYQLAAQLRAAAMVNDHADSTTSGPSTSRPPAEQPVIADGQQAPIARPVITAPAMPLPNFQATFGPPPPVTVLYPPRFEVISGQFLGIPPICTSIVFCPELNCRVGVIGYGGRLLIYISYQ
ncbi:uncharacterized protein LOC135129952 [Zophobas morio]|uniref:uncharacterized protein LOC135129952 n=1 Tax=Zophobas morio TaxID=2755281 RepID=UPI0030837021